MTNTSAAILTTTLNLEIAAVPSQVMLKKTHFGLDHNMVSEQVLEHRMLCSGKNFS